MPFKDLCFRLLKQANWQPKHAVDLSQLPSGITATKQLDEYRELLEDIEKQTGYFSKRTNWPSNNHARTLDETLTYLHEQSAQPSRQPRLRERPKFLERQRE